MGIKTSFGKERCEDGCKGKWKNRLWKLIYDVHTIFNPKQIREHSVLGSQIVFVFYSLTMKYIHAFKMYLVE